MSVQYPNKIYTLTEKVDRDGVKSHFAIVVAASDKATARQFVKDTIGIDVEPIWLMNACYPTIWVSDGSEPAKIQAKLLSNMRMHVMSSGKVM